MADKPSSTVTRRAALGKLAAVAVVPAALAACKPDPAKPGKPGKRQRVFRKRKAGYMKHGAVLQTSFRSTFIVDGRKTDPKKRMLHYADAQGRVFGLDPKTKIAAFRAFDPAKDGGAVLSKHRLGAVAETAALEGLTTDASGTVTPTREQCMRACNTLLDAIAVHAAKPTGRPPFRLVDLAAGIAYRYDLRDVLTRLIAVQWPSGKDVEARRQAHQAALDDLNGSKPLGGVKHLHRVLRWNRRVTVATWGTFSGNKVRKLRFGDMV